MNTEESTIFSAFLFCFLIFVFFSEIQASKHQKSCYSSCGDIREIRYPFSLKGDPVGCGGYEYQLSCQSNKTILEFDSGKYYVKNINYHKSMISVVDVNLANGSCSLPTKSLSPNSIVILHFYIYDSLYASFVNCTRNIVDQADRKVPCLSGNQSNVYVIYGGRTISDIPESCSIISLVPVHDQNEKNISYEAIRNLMELGFEFRWLHVGSCYYFFPLPGIFCLNTNKVFKIILMTVEYFTLIVTSVLGAPIHALIIGRFILAPVVLLVFLIHKYRKTLKRVDNVEKFLRNQQSWIPKRYSYPEIIAMTSHFTHKLGQGGFGSVYTGQLHSGSLIAVKMLENSKFSAEEFINEVSTIGRIHHLNVVQLLGFCSEGSKRALVYEYMPNGSLDRHIFSRKGTDQSFSWEKLHEIALGTARGIEYLHEGCDVCILHFDIKPHNILLDHNFIPKVSDFGLAKFYPKESDLVSISATRGTIGYIAPELISRNFGTVSCKSDVYSFGMVLLEMAGGRRNSNMNETRSSKAYFPSWVYDQISKGGDLELRNATEIESIIARKLCMIGLWCIQVKAADRPSMTKVLEMLEGSTDDLQMPPRPFFSSSPHMSGREIESYPSTELRISESIEECSE